jgi:diguanylate cyclase (GGDEF)-like protein
MLTGGLVLNVYTLFLTFLLLLFQENDRKSRSNLEFLKLIGLLALLVGVSAIGDVGKLEGGDGIYLQMFSSYFVFAFDPFGFLFSLSYIDCYTAAVDKRKRQAFLVPMRVYAYLNLVLVTVSTLLNLKWFYYYEGQEYFRGSFYMLRGFIHVALCLMVLLYVITFRENIARNCRLPIMMFPLIVAFGGYLQLMVINMNIEYAATVIACLLLFIYVQKRDVNLDYLTGVVNRRGIDMALRKAISDSRDKQFSAIMIDVDFFKSINDRFGHKVGDEVLENIADVLRESFEAGDIVGRFGGDEFCVISRITDSGELNKRVGIIKESVSCLDWSNKALMELSISCGAAVYDFESGLKPKEFMESIDRLMYEEKLRHHLKDRRSRQNA